MSIDIIIPRFIAAEQRAFTGDGGEPNPNKPTLTTHVNLLTL